MSMVAAPTKQIQRATNSRRDRISPTYGVRPLALSTDEKHGHGVVKLAERLRRVRRFANWMDAKYRIPLTPIRFGLDSAIGFIPGVGGAFTAVSSGWLMREAFRAGVSKRILARMAANTAVDVVGGAVPLVGDLFDVYWKSHLRNARLLEQHVEERLGLGTVAERSEIAVIRNRE